MKLRKRLTAPVLLLALAVLLSGCTPALAPSYIDTVAEITSAPTPIPTPVPYSSQGIPRVRGEMETAAYWIGQLEDPDALLATAEEIDRANSENYINEETRMTDLPAYPEAIAAASLRAMAENVLQADYSDYYAPDAHPDAGFYQTLYDAMAPELLPPEPDAEIPVSWGVAVEPAMVRSYPTDIQLLTAPGDVEFDYFDLSVLYPGEAVAVLWTSSDGAWYYIIARQLGGWVRAASLALTDRDTWLIFADPESPWVVTAASATLGETVYPTGTVFPEREGKVLLPDWDDEGRLILREEAPAEGLTLGWLPLTRRNLIIQAFVSLGEPYGWGGRNGLDCSQYTSRLYRYFGVHLARNTSWQPHCAGKTWDMEGMSGEQKLTALKTLGPGALAFMRGHVMVYLGEDDGRPCVIHSLYSWSEEGSVRQVCGRVAVSDLLIYRASNGKTFLESLTWLLLP